MAARHDSIDSQENKVHQFKQDDEDRDSRQNTSENKERHQRFASKYKSMGVAMNLPSVGADQMSQISSHRSQGRLKIKTSKVQESIARLRIADKSKDRGDSRDGPQMDDPDSYVDNETNTRNNVELLYNKSSEDRGAL